MFGHQFYPTPLTLGLKLVSLIDWRNHTGAVMDVSAGKGDLLTAYAVRQTRGYCWLFEGNDDRTNRREMQFEVFAQGAQERLESDLMQEDIARAIQSCGKDLWAVEIDPDLQNVLRGRGFRVVGSDWLTYSDMLQPSVVLMNPPFDNGDVHLLKVMDWLYSGQVACILNAETIRNPYTQTRKDLVKRLEALGATVEYMQGQFATAERPTGVEIAVIYIDLRKSIEDDIFADCKDAACDHVAVDGVDESGEIVFSDRITALVQRYEDKKHRGVELIIEFEKKARGLPFLSIHQEGFSAPSSGLDKKTYRTELVKARINHYLTELRQAEWMDMMNDPAITKYLTKAKKSEYQKQLAKYSQMDFTEANIRTFVAAISANYPEVLAQAIESIWDEWTTKHTYYEECRNNTHYYNGWKSNKASYVNKKLVMPRMSPYDTMFKSWRRLDWGTSERFADYEKVMSYFDGGRTDFEPMTDIINRAIENGQTSKIQTEYFEVTFYQKGTVHLTFRDETIRRRFNIFVGSRKNFLPPDYGTKPMSAMNEEEKAVAESFEGAKNYKQDAGVNPFTSMALGGVRDDLLKIAA